jgi:hypothetical protein
MTEWSTDAIARSRNTKPTAPARWTPGRRSERIVEVEREIVIGNVRIGRPITTSLLAIVRVERKAKQASVCVRDGR